MVCFYIVRHGQTLLNSLDRAQGWLIHRSPKQESRWRLT